jgi:hypothetical protein
MDGFRKKIIIILPFLSSLLPSILFLSFQNSYSQELQREYRSGYFLGRGDTGIATAKGMEAIFYNPAGVAQGKGILSEVIAASPQVEATQNLGQLYNSYNGGNTSALQILAQNQNTVFSGAAQNYTGLIFRKVSLGILDRANGNAYEGIDPNTGIPTANIYAANRVGAYLTLSNNFYDDRLYLGISGKYLQKKEVNLSLSTLSAETQLSNNSLNSVINNSLNQGAGIGADIGLIYILSKEYSTQFGLVYRNIGMEYKWTTPDGSTAPTSEPTVLDLGFSTSFGTKRSRVIISSDIRDVTNVQSAVFGKRVHLGLEYTLNDTFGIMAGLNQGYPTFGAFLHISFLKLDGGMYTEEIGSRIGEHPSQRIFGRAVVGWLL